MACCWTRNSVDSSHIRNVLQRSVLGLCIPPNEWNGFSRSCCKYESYDLTKVIKIEKRSFIVVVSGEVVVKLSSIKAHDQFSKRKNESSTDDAASAEVVVFKPGELINFFGLTSLTPEESSFIKIGSDGTISSGNLKLSFTARSTHGSAALVSVDVDSIKLFLQSKPYLSTLSFLVNTKLGSFLQSSTYLHGIGHAKLSLLGPMLKIKPTAIGQHLTSYGIDGGGAESLNVDLFSSKRISADNSTRPPKIPISAAGIILYGKMIRVYGSVDLTTFEKDDDFFGYDREFEIYDATPKAFDKILHSSLPAKYKSEIRDKSRPPALSRSSTVSRSISFIGGLYNNSDAQILASTSAGYVCVGESETRSKCDYGSFLKQGEAFGVEQHILDCRMVMHNVYSCSCGLVGIIEESVFDAFKKVDSRFIDCIRCNLVLEMLDDVKAAVPFLAGIDNSSVKAQLSSSVTLQTHPTNSVVHHQGAKGENIFIVVCGAVEESVKVDNGDGSYEVVFKGVWESGSYIGEVAVVTDSPYSVTNTTIEPTVLICISSHTFRTLFDDNRNKLAELKVRIAGSSVDLSDILSYSPGYASLMEYLNQEHASENLQFITHVDRFLEMANRLQNQLVVDVKADLINRKLFLLSQDSILSTLSSDTSTHISPLESPTSTTRKPSTYIAQANHHINTNATGEKSYIVAFNSGMLELQEVGKIIIDRFITVGSELQVNIPGKMRIESEALFREWLQMGAKIDIGRVEAMLLEFNKNSSESMDISTRTLIQAIEASGNGIGDALIPPAALALRIFAAPREEIFLLIKRDTLPRWKQSPLFEKFLASVKKYEKDNTFKSVSRSSRLTNRFEKTSKIEKSMV